MVVVPGGHWLPLLVTCVKCSLTSTQTGGLHDIVAKGKQIYGTASTAYGVYRAAKDAYTTAREYWPMIREGLQGLEMVA